MKKVVMFAFWGRRENVELQLPFIRRILAEHSNVEFHGWNLARNNDDARWLKTLSGDGIQIRNDFAGPRAFTKMSNVWKHYGDEQTNDGTLYVKFDDDVVFIETERFGDFLSAIEDNPGALISAKTINNGACTPLEPELWRGFSQLRIPLLDVHMSNEYAAMSHDFMFKNWQKLIGQELELIPTQDWLSINFIGMDWGVLHYVADRIGQRSPAHIAGRNWPNGARIGDEGACNLVERAILEGFLVAHLTFGPQKVTDNQAHALRREYEKINDLYLAESVQKLNTP